MSSFSHAMTGFRIALVAVALYLVGGCARGEISETSGGPTAEEFVSFYSPRSIKVLPFTKPRSFDDDNFPDGIAVSLQPRDGAGDPVKAYGTFLFELYAYRPASAVRGARSVVRPNEARETRFRILAEGAAVPAHHPGESGTSNLQLQPV